MEIGIFSQASLRNILRAKRKYCVPKSLHSKREDNADGKQVLWMDA